ncbi:MAG: hypothetical protein ACREBR_03865, partial [bacterium]
MSNSLSALMQWDCALNYNETESPENEQFVDLCSYMHKDAINWENIGVINNYPDYCAYRFPVRFVGLDAKASLVL